MTQRGFTLIEMLVAMAIFAAISTMAYLSLDSLLRSQEQTRAEARRIGEVQQAVTILTRDLMQLLPRPAREASHGDFLPALTAGTDVVSGIEFTRGGWRNPLERPRSSLQRVAYRVSEGKLMRYTWLHLDRAQDAQPTRAEVLDGVERLAVRFLETDDQWREQWPPLDRTGRPDLRALPIAVEVALDLEDWGRVRRVVELPEGKDAGAGIGLPGDEEGEDSK